MALICNKFEEIRHLIFEQREERKSNQSKNQKIIQISYLRNLIKKIKTKTNKGLFKVGETLTIDGDGLIGGCKCVVVSGGGGEM